MSLDRHVTDIQTGMSGKQKGKSSIQTGISSEQTGISGKSTGMSGKYTGLSSVQYRRAYQLFSTERLTGHADKHIKCTASHIKSRLIRYTEHRNADRQVR
jgi:hypothetical protein